MRTSQVAERAGITQTYLWMLERGKQNTGSQRGRSPRPSPRVLIALAQALNLEPTELFQLAGHPLPPPAETRDEPSKQAPVSAVQQAAVRAGPPYDLLVPPHALIGRENDLEWLLARLRPQHGATVPAESPASDQTRSIKPAGAVVALTGMGGIGKTALAAEAIRRVHEQGLFPDGIAVVHREHYTGHPTDATEILARIIARFNYQRQVREAIDPAAASAAARSLLEGRHTLIVLDDLDPRTSLLDLADPLRAAGATVLITARHKLPTTVVPPDMQRSLHLLDEDDALNLFVQSYGYTSFDNLPDPKKQTAAAKKIVAVLGRYPLAICIAGAYARALERDLTNLAVELAKDPLNLKLPADGVSKLEFDLRTVATDSKSHTIKDALQGSLDHLPEDTQRLFGSMTIFPSHEVSRAVLCEVARALGLSEPDTSVELLVRRFLLDAFTLDVDTPAELASYGDRERLKIHPLLHSFAAKWAVEHGMDGALETAKWSVARYYRRYLHRLGLPLREEKFPQRARAWAVSTGLVQVHSFTLAHPVETQWCEIAYRDELHRQLHEWIERDEENIVGALLWAHEARQHEPRPDAIRELDAIVFHLCLGLHSYWLARSSSMQALEYLQWGCDAAHNLSDAGIIELQIALGQAHLQCGNLDQAKAIFTGLLQAPSSDSQRLTNQHTGEILNALGRIERQRGNLNEAKERYTRSLALAREADEQDWRGQVEAMTALGRIAQQRGTLDEAQQTYYEPALSIARSIRDRGSEGELLSLLGRIAYRHGQLERAERNFFASLQIRRELHDKRGEARVLTFLGEISLARDNLKQAREYLEESLQKRRDALDRPGEAVVRALLGQLAVREAEQRYQQRHDEAVALYEEAREIDVRLGDQRGEGAVSELLGEELLAAGWLDEAEQQFKASRVLRRKVQDRRGYGNLCLSFARLAQARGQFISAERLFQTGLRILEKLDLVAYAHACHTFGVFLRQRGQPDRGNSYIQKAERQFIEMGIAYPGRHLTRGGSASRIAREDWTTI
jgi:tetratricopeptide (TPR) repeat protein/transcriptional regulator with XRE-family HTH domain